MVLDKLIPKKKELEEQEYPEEFEPSKKISTDDPDIKEFLEKRRERGEKKDGEENTPQETVPKEETKGSGVVPESLEESQGQEEPLITEGGSEESLIENPRQEFNEGKITYTKSFNIPVDHENLGTAKKILDDNVRNGFVIAFQAGTYVDKNNVESIKKVLDYFVKNNFKVVIASESVQEISNATK